MEKIITAYATSESSVEEIEQNEKPQQSDNPNDVDVISVASSTTIDVKRPENNATQPMSHENISEENSRYEGK